MRQPILYGWYRDPIYLYIGKSNAGLSRILTHDKINVVEPLLDQDEIHIFELTKEIAIMEAELIAHFNPKYNLVYSHKEPKEVPCLKCNKLFWQNRAWQKYCSRSCSGSNAHYSTRAFHNVK